MNDQQKLNWVNVLAFLQRQYNTQSIRQKQWALERQTLAQRITSLESQLTANQNITNDLNCRIKILEVALKEERLRKPNQSGGKAISEDKIQSLLDRLKVKPQHQTQHHEDFLKELTKDMSLFQELPKTVRQAYNKQNLPEIAPKTTWKETKATGVHLDVVTSLAAIESKGQNYVATCSQDCLIKVWNINSFLKDESTQPKQVLRKHTGPIFSMTTGVNPYDESERLLLSGGIEGDIKGWTLTEGKAKWVGSWSSRGDEQQTVWDLTLQDKLVLSCGSEGVVRLFEVTRKEQLQLQHLKDFKERQFNQTAIKWTASDHFAAGCCSAPRIHLWNTQGRIVQKFIYETQKTLFIGVGEGKGMKKGLNDAHEAPASQVNKLEYMKQTRVLAAGCEDGEVRLFSYGSGKVVGKLPASGSVTALMADNWQITAGTHSGHIHIWDCRTYKQLEKKESAHLRKYETGVTALIQAGGMLVSSGADGIVKVYQQ